MTSAKNGADESKSSDEQGPELKGDFFNVFLLTLFYTMQYIPYGFIMGLSTILQSKKMVTYNDQSLYSIIVWPFSVKLLWAPIVDSLYIHRIGRRKTWFILSQYITSVFFLYFANNVNDWLPESGKPNVIMITSVLFAICTLIAIQDIAVDGWSLTILKKNNVSYASMCCMSGYAIGMVIGSTVLVLLSADDACKKYERFTNCSGGIISIKSFLYFCCIVFLLIPTLVGIFKKEKDNRLEENYVNISILQNYKLVWKILKLPDMKLFVCVLLTASIGFCTMESVAKFKLIDAGVSEQDIAVIQPFSFILNIFLPFVLAKYTAGPKPMRLYLRLVPIRLLWAIAYTGLIYYTPSLIKINGIVDVPKYYYFFIGFIFLVNESLNNIMAIAILSFFNRISDPRFGGTYLTLFNTIRNIGYTLPNTLILKMVDYLTFNECSNNAQNSCSSKKLIDTCSVSGGNCETLVEGYYIEVILCLTAGFVWYCIFKRRISNFESMDRSQWMVDFIRTDLEMHKL